MHVLIRHGEPPPAEMVKAAVNIQQEYADSVGDAEHKVYCGLLKEVTLLQLTLQQIHSLVSVLREAYNELLAKSLNDLLKSSLKFDIRNLEEYDKNLDRALRRSKGLKIELDLKTIALKAVEKKYEDLNKKPSREFYYGILITLSDDAGYHLYDEIPTWEFCERMKRFKVRHEKLAANGGRKNR